MSADEFSHIVEQACEAIAQRLDRSLPEGSVFSVIAWNPETRETHTWTLNEMEPFALANLLEGGAQALRHPERIRGGN